MARINIEDSLFKDNRFYDLVVKLGGLDTALGTLVRAWIVAQQYWRSELGIPKPVWKSQNLSMELIACGLAEDRGDFIYMRGSVEQFAWLKERSEAGKKGGPAAAKARREIIEESKRRKSSEHVGNRRNTSSSSFSISNKEIESVCISISGEEKASLSSIRSVDVEKQTHTQLREQIQKCCSTWMDTLKHFGIERVIIPSERTEIARAIQAHGAEAVDLALYGARYEPKFDDFDPKNFVSVARIFGRDKNGKLRIDRYVNYAAQNKAAQSQKVREWA